MRKSVKILFVTIIAAIATGAFIFYGFFYAPEPTYAYENATGFSSEEYFSQYTIPAFVVTDIGASQIKINHTFTSGFETEADFSQFYIVPQNHMGTASHKLAHEKTHSGSYAHKGWIYRRNPVVAGQNTNHRAYPTVQLQKNPTGVFYNRTLVDFWVWLEIDLSAVENQEWFSFATFTAYADDHWYRAYLVNMDAGGRVNLMHVPNQTQSILDIYQNNDTVFPQKEWVRLTIYIDLNAENVYGKPYLVVWQNGILVSGATFSDRITPYSVPESSWPPCLNTWDQVNLTQAEDLCGLNYTGALAQAHFGLYAPPLLASGLVYNDDLVIANVDVS